jgi:hypothetical protein
VAPFPCSPSNWTQANNNGGFPATFCPWTYLPWRVWIPSSPQNIDNTMTTILRQRYLPNSAHGGVNNPDTYTISTVGIKPTTTDQGFSGAPMYVASSSDPVVHVRCTGAPYGCSDGNGNRLDPNATFDIRIPAWARPPCIYCTFPADNGIGILLPTGQEFGMYQCKWTRDVVDGDTIGNGGSLCDFEGAYIAKYTTDQGVNTGNTSGGGLQTAGSTFWDEVVNKGQINHSLVSFVGCVTGQRWPAKVPSGRCNGFTGIPSGSLIWLNEDRPTIDQDSRIPANMKVFAYALHEHGMYVLDTGGWASNTDSSLSQIAVEQILAPLQANILTQSPWVPWFLQYNGGLPTGGDAIIKIQNNNIMPWNLLSNNLFVLSSCYATGKCNDSIPDPGNITGNPPTITINNPISVPNGGSGTYSTATSPLTNFNGQAASNGGTGLAVSLNCTTCSGGTVSGTTSWSVAGLGLASGANTIIMKAQDSNGSSTATLTVTYTPTGPPTITIQTPVNVANGGTGTYSTGTSPLTSLAGTAASHGGTGLNVTISCTPACSGSTVSGTTNWQVPSIPLTSGTNTIVMHATDSNGSSTAALNVTYRIP